MNSEEKLCFETKALGKLKILAFIGNNALLEKMYDTPEKYIIASGFNINERSWNFGSYFTNLKDAFKEFAEKTNIQINLLAKEPIEEREIEVKTTNDLFKKIYRDLKAEISKDSKEIFVKEYYIPSINNHPNDKTISDHYFISGIEMELDKMMSYFQDKVFYTYHGDKYFFSNDENMAIKRMKQEIRNGYVEIVDNIGDDIEYFGLENEM